MLATNDVRLSFEQWLPIATPRAELVDGVEDFTRTFESPQMQATSVRHALTCTRVARALDAALEAVGSTCYALNEGPAVKTLERYGRIPDVSIACEVQDWDAAKFSPCVVIEVLSESSARIDHGEKVREYLALEYIQHYLVIDAQLQIATHYEPGTAFAARYTKPAQLISLEPPGIVIRLGDLFNPRCSELQTPSRPPS